MSSKGRKIKGRKSYHVILILFLIIAVVFFLYKELYKEPYKPEIQKHVKPEKKPEILPKIAIVIDDLGSNKNIVLSIFDIKSSLTLSILPLETYTKWIAGEGYRRGYDIIGHIPMETKEPHRLGKGGLYTWMTADEIRETLEEDFNSIPHIKAVSNHMGSAFTEDERTMDTFMSVVKEHGLFFLDSRTTDKTVSKKLAKKYGVIVLKRDLFLDIKDNPEHIKSNWKNLVAIAKKKGYAIALAHPKKNTINFLKHTLPSKDVTVVPISKIPVSP